MKAKTEDRSEYARSLFDSQENRRRLIERVLNVAPTGPDVRPASAEADVYRAEEERRDKRDPLRSEIDEDVQREKIPNDENPPGELDERSTARRHRHVESRRDAPRDRRGPPGRREGDRDRRSSAVAADDGLRKIRKRDVRRRERTRTTREQDGETQKTFLHDA